jgi:hypothetical protein
MDNSSKEQKKPEIKRRLTTSEQMGISRMKQKGSSNSGPIFCSSDSSNNGSLELVIDKNLDPRDANDLFESRIFEATGAVNCKVGLQLLSITGKAIGPSKTSGQELAKQLDTLAQSMQALAPQDEYEGQLIAQLIVLHEHAMDWLGRAARTERVDFANVYLNGASKLLTRHHETLESLLKYRRKGEQRVQVEHVHVNAGGQASVGNVSTGGRMNQKNEEGPHAKV